MTRRLRCYVAAPRSLARSVVQIHTMLEDHDVKPMSLWADGVMSAPPSPDYTLDPRRARWILDDNRKAIAASDVVFAYLPDPVETLNRYGDTHAGSYPKETYCELEFARASGKYIVILGSGDMIPLSLLVACDDGDARVIPTVSMAIDLIVMMANACRHLVDALPCLRDTWGHDNPHQDAEDAAARWRLIPGG